MKLTVLGCNGPHPEKGGACSGYLVETENARVLLDCGSGVLSKLGDRVETLDAVILSHLHFDHMSDLLPLMYRCFKRGTRLRLFMPMQENFMRSLLIREYDASDIAAGGQIGDITFTAEMMRHPVPSYAMRLEAEGKTLCYSGDTNTCDALSGFVHDADLFLCDACFTAALWDENKPHLSAYLAAQTAKAANARRLVLTHFNPGSDKKLLLKEAKTAFENTCLAHCRLELKV